MIEVCFFVVFVFITSPFSTHLRIYPIRTWIGCKQKSIMNAHRFSPPEHCTFLGFRKMYRVYVRHTNVAMIKVGGRERIL